VSDEALLEGQATKELNTALVFSHLPGYASFIKESYLIPYIQEQIVISRQINLPMLKYFAGIPDDELIAMSVTSNREFLTYAEENKLSEQIKKSLEVWKSDQLGIIKRDEVTAEDITLAGYMRKKAMLKFLPSYTTDVFEAIEIAKEIDAYTVASETAATNIYIQLLKNRIADQAFFADIIATTTPGLNYVFDIVNYKLRYTNKNYLKFFGRNFDELAEMGRTLLDNVIHPDDIEVTLDGNKQCTAAADGDVISWEYRLKGTDGNYYWMRNYASVFKRDAQGIPQEIVGIILDVDTEKRTGDKLLLREKQLLDAQAQAKLGSFELDVVTGKMDVTPQFKEIYELSDFNLYTLIDHVHPADRNRVNDNRDKAIAEDGIYDNEYRYQINGKEKVIWSRGTITYKDGRKIMNGTAMDVTTRHKMIDDLVQSQELYRQAQKIANIGNWSWNLETNEVRWSDELFHIYEMEPGDGNVQPKDTRAFRHPDDIARVDDEMQTLTDLHIPSDYNFRIILPGGRIKHLNVKGDVARNDQGKVTDMFGTVQDITEKQSLIEKLQESDLLFKQAQELSRLGNWTWDLATGNITWSDELYKIYGMEVGSEINFEEIIAYNDVPDVVSIKNTLRTAKETLQPSDTYYHITLKDGTRKVLHAKTETIANAGEASKMVGTIQDVTDKQLLIEKLQENDELFKQAQARTHIGNWTWDIPANKVTWSDEMYRVYGLEPQSEEVSYETYIAHIHPDDRDNRIKQVQEVFETGLPEDHHYRIITPAGEVRILHTKSELQYDKNGVPAKMTGTCQDVTEKQQLIEQLQNSDGLYQQAQAISHIGNWSWDYETKKMKWSDELYHIYEIEPQSLDTSAITAQYNHPEDDEMVRQSLRNAIEHQEPFDFNYRIVLKDGRMKTLNARGEIKRNSIPRSFNIYGTVQDITEQKNTERQLKEYQEFIEKITDVTPSIIASYNIHTGRFSFINDAVEKLLGYAPAKVMEEGVPFMSSIIHPDDAAALMEKNARALEEANQAPHNGDEPVVEFKYRMQNAAGEYRWFHTYGTIFERNEKGMVDSVLNISVDITDQEVVEQALYQKNLQLQQSNTSLEEYAYVASHDLKEPLRKISTFSDRILTTQYNTLNEESKVYFNKIIIAANRMQKMINDLLSVSTILGNNAYEASDLNIILAEALQPLDHKLEESKAVIESGNLPVVSVVPSQFRQLFQNLVGNSLKFAKQGVPPHIKLSSKTVSAKEVEQYNLTKAKKYLQIEIEDNGIGFDNQYAGKIFAIFQRLHGKTEYDGTGIGLAICKKVVENHGGGMTAYGVPGKGATFTIIIPV